ncbi:MAG: GspE/PulE family protein [bacterium]|nr:GspE/PulE family protein [bacterium]
MSSSPHVGKSFKGAEEKFSEKMKTMGLEKQENDAKNLAHIADFGYVYLVGVAITPGLLEMIPVDIAKKLQLICFQSQEGKFFFASIDPLGDDVEDYIKKFEKTNHCTVQLHTMSQASFDAVMKLYAKLPTLATEQHGVSINQDDLDKYKEGFSDIRKIQEQIQDVNVTDILTLLISVALSTNASDIHVEAEEKDIKLRLRIDGVLHNIASLPPEDWKKIISRIKLLAKVKINISDRPQDGRFTIFLKDDEVDVRVSTLPTSYGESVVMRLLRSSSAGLQFADLGLADYTFRTLKREVERPNGMIITTGPTGSGKTTTLYAMLNHLNSSEVKIITLEDPIEYKLGGINQSQVDPTKDYTFANGLRSILRQDPDVVMVGEIRDFETADIAINAALTGHLVISTIHTNSAAGAIPRLLAIGVKPFLLAPALTALIGQRLVRRLCEKCKKEITPDTETLERVKGYLSSLSPASGVKVDINTMKFFGPVGCDDCYGIGYKGRIGIFEIMTINKEIEAIMLSPQVSEYGIQENAVKNGMITMVQEGLLRAVSGITSIEEVFSVAQ